jgi:hypothetical protein
VVSFLVLAHDPEGVKDVLGLDCSEAIDVKHRGIEVGLEKCTSAGVPPEWRTVITHILGVGPKPPRRVR